MHSGSLRNDRRVKAIRTATGAAGYGIFHMLLEALTDADYTTLSVDSFELELLAGDFGVSVTEIDSLLQIGKKVGYFLVNEAQMLTCPELNKWLEMHFEKRNRSRNRGSGDSPSQPVTEMGVSVTETPHNTIHNTTVHNNTETPPTPGVGAFEVELADSKKNEGPAAAENHHADDSLASASHTKGAAASADSRPEFRAEPIWAKPMRLLADQMAEYFKLTQAQQDGRMRLGRFCRLQFETGQGELLSTQFHAYRAYKAERDERVHSWKAYLGDESQGYANGAWNEKDWVAALADARKSQPHGNANLRRAGYDASDASSRINIPARINYQNDAA